LSCDKASKVTAIHCPLGIAMNRVMALRANGHPRLCVQVVGAFPAASMMHLGGLATRQNPLTRAHLAHRTMGQETSRQSVVFNSVTSALGRFSADALTFLGWFTIGIFRSIPWCLGMFRFGAFHTCVRVTWFAAAPARSPSAARTFRRRDIHGPPVGECT
jgi:hypothetical protein